MVVKNGFIGIAGKVFSELLRSHADSSELIQWFVDPVEEASRGVELINDRVQAFVLPSIRPSEKMFYKALEEGSTVD